MPKNKLFSKKNKNNPNLFDSMIAPKPEITELETSVPLTKKETQPSRKMTLLELSKFIEDIKEKLPLLEKKVENRSDDELRLLSLMRTIKKFSETDFLEKSNDSIIKIEILKDIIPMYVDKDIDWKPYEFVETELNNTVAPIKEPIDALNLTSNQTRSLIQELQEFQFNGDKQNHQKTFSISKKNGSLDLLADLKNALRRNKDNAGCVKKSNASDGNNHSNVSSELAEKLAKRRANLEKETIANVNDRVSKHDLSETNDNTLPTILTLAKIGNELLDALEPYLRPEEKESVYLFEIRELICLNQFNKKYLADLLDYLKNNTTIAGFFEKNQRLSIILEDSNLTKLKKLLLTAQKFIEEEVSEIIDSSPTSSGMFFNSQDTKPIIVGETIKPTLSR